MQVGGSESKYETPRGHDEVKATADVPAPFICGRFHFYATRYLIGDMKRPGIAPGPSNFG
jgi:hypothetical protein